MGGASNSGGGVLLAHFPEKLLEALSEKINGALPSGLTYYPLSKPGERFPFADPEKAPRLEPRPKDDALFLHGMLDGLGAIEAAAYSKLGEMGPFARRADFRNRRRHQKPRLDAGSRPAFACRIGAARIH